MLGNILVEKKTGSQNAYDAVEFDLSFIKSFEYFGWLLSFTRKFKSG